MRMDPRGKCDDPRVLDGECVCGFGLFERSADADHDIGARFTRAGDYRVAVAVERGVGEVAVAVDEGFHAVAARGYLRSIQSRIGPAT